MIKIHLKQLSTHNINHGIYISLEGKTKLAGFFSAKLQKRQTSWLLCEIEDWHSQSLFVTSARTSFKPIETSTSLQIASHESINTLENWLQNMMYIYPLDSHF